MTQPTMLGYIHDQPRALLECFLNRKEFIDPMVHVFKENDIRKVYLLGSGTSYHASLAIKNYLETYLQVEAEVCIPTMFTHYVKVNNNKIYNNRQILVIGISQSGTSYSTVNAMKKAKDMGYLTVALTEDLNSMICDQVEVVDHLLCGKELIPIETRGYTVTVLTGYLWAVEVSKALGMLDDQRYQEILLKTEKMLKNYDSYLEEAEEWYQLHHSELFSFRHGHITAYGNNYCTALEGVLKLYETFRMPLSAYELEELIHGPQMAFEDTTYIFIIASDEVELKRVPLFVQWFKENEVTEHIFVFSNKMEEVSNKDLKFKTEIFEDLSPLVYTLPFQIMAARNSLAAGYDTSKRRPKRQAFAHKYE
ncbi:SIS domain-containing protein [Traorella massiliensis]|uniref:SIS domain-containing protein n=1 Tax=Traorella massiliensis TaxID=1903263 RepID=UPI0023535E38|nr:SIS domain-containing protein [Traorella massiliensis]